ncbi:hypothetical protein WJX81_002389 [Elliptochloris bilobata]|uniref:Uncharacterized protein n=1 Tax=Elliptochloris bilobata TaxID=381761 RepID=A0AAW1QZJ0_9CHLO
MTAAGAALRSVRQQLADGFSTLRGSPRELYLIFALQVLEAFNYFAFSLLIPLYLTAEFGISDFQAGTYYGLWGTLLVAYGILFSGLIDLLGVRGSLVLCYLVSIVGRYVVAATHSKTTLLLSWLGPVTIAGSLGTPVLTIGIKRYTTPTSRGFAFSLFYSCMNIAGLGCGVVLDFFRVRLRHGFNIASLPADSLLNDGSRLLLASTSVASVLALMISLALRESAALPAAAAPEPKRGGQDVAETRKPLLAGQRAEEEVCVHADGTGAAAHLITAPAQPTQLTLVNFFSELGVVMASRETWKYLVMCVLTVNLKQIFRHVDATMPKFLIRMFGCDAPVGIIYGINPFIIIFLVPVVGALFTRVQHFDMIHYGSYLSALSPFWLVAFPQEWAAVAFVVTLSLGESVWSPRWYDYSMSLAPEGREGLFTALASAPLFAAKLPTGMLSGKLLQDFCPDTAPCGAAERGAGSGGTGTCDARALWGVIGAITATSPLLILVLQRWVRPAPAPSLPLHSADGPDGRAGAPTASEADHDPATVAPPRPRSALAIPVHDLIEDEAAVEGVLAWEEAHRQAPR